MAKIDRYIRNSPAIYKAKINPIINALFDAWAEGDDSVEIDIQNTKDQIFVATAEGEFLDRLASSVGVSRPSEIGLLDEDFRQLIPNLSLKAKQVRSIFYDTMDVFWGPLFSRANITSSNFEPYNVSVGDKLVVIIDGTLTQEVVALDGEIATDGAATAEEIAAIISRLNNATGSVIQDELTGNNSVNIRTNTTGPRGSIEIDSSSTMVSASKVDFLVDQEVTILDFDQRTTVYEINHREMIIEIPAIVPTLRRTLKGSHHLHADESIEPPVAPANEVWAGSFLFNPGGSAFTITQNSAVIQEILEEGEVYVKVTVDDASNIPDEPGFLIFGFGRSDEEFPVEYIGRPNDSTILLDPAHVFEKDHLVGTTVNFLSARDAYEPRQDGTDLAIYLTSPVDARAKVQEILETLKAAGIVITFRVLLPDYKYLCKNPFEASD